MYPFVLPPPPAGTAPAPAGTAAAADVVALKCGFVSIVIVDSMGVVFTAAVAEAAGAVNGPAVM